MKITDLEMFHILPRWMFLKISTDEGVCGWGEPVLEGRSRTVETAVHELRSILIGADPLQITHLWQAIYRSAYYRGGPILMSALSGVEMALWDIKGKYHGLPVHQMLGGRCRDRVRMYGHIKPTAIAGGIPVEEMVNIALRRKEQGFTVMKYSLIPPIRPLDSPAAVRSIVDRFAAVRSAVGEAVDVAVDFHGRTSPAMAIRLAKELEPLHPFFIEEPCLPENVDEMVRVARSTSIPIASGERLFTKWGFRELIEKQAVSVVQPDLCHCGGIFEARQIAGMAETYYMQVAPHNPLGPISLAACLQLAASIPNFLAQEHPGMPDGTDLGKGILRHPFAVRTDGTVAVPEGPGLGVEVMEEALEDHRFEGNWETPRLLFEDGSVAEW